MGDNCVAWPMGQTFPIMLVLLLLKLKLCQSRVLSMRPNLEMDDTCGQNRTVIGNWFINHGGVDLLLDPRPPLVGPVVDDPYEDPHNPPIDPETEGVCSMKWSEERDPSTNHLKYHLANFTTKEESEANGFTVTHAGHCGACSSLQDLGVYIRQNLTEKLGHTKRNI